MAVCAPPTELGLVLPFPGSDLDKEDICRLELRSELLHFGFSSITIVLWFEKFAARPAPRLRIEAIAKFGIFGVADVEGKDIPINGFPLKQPSCS